jgi:4-hydroxy-tetrahydrodipicolinate synthase
MISGSIVALVTPMSADGAVDYDALRALVDWHIQEGTDAIVAVGTTGESSTLGVYEHVQVVRRVVEVAKGRVPVIAGTGANSTSEAIELTREGKKAGAQAALMVTPYYNRPPQEGLYQHYKKVAETVDIPIILYNVPGRTACDMVPATVKRLAQVPGIVGLKEAHGTIGRIQDLLKLGLPGDFTLLSGDDATACESILLGCHGDISVTANVAPRLMHEMVAAARRGDRKLATELDAKLQPLHKHLFVEPNPIPVKWALQQMKKIGPGIRLPLVPLDPAHEETVRGALRAAGAM